MRYLFILFLILCIVVLQAQVKLNFEYKKVILKNGLTVILSEDHSQPIVYGVVVTKAGGKDDPPDATGMAHYMEHMLFKGTDKLGTTNWEKEKIYLDSIVQMYEKLSQTKDNEERKKIQKKINDLSVKANEYVIPNELDKLLKQTGATDVNANTSYDRTVFHNSFHPSEIYRWIEIYSHRFINPVFRSFQSELETVYEEKNLYSDMFIFNLFEEFNKNFFKKHPYGQQPLIGTIEHLKNPSLHKMYEFYRTYYVPNNMALILVGDFSIEEILPVIEEKFGVWESKPLPQRKIWEEEDFKGREFVEKRMSPIRIGLLGFRAPNIKQEDELTFELAVSLLSNSTGTGLLDELSLNNKLLAAQAIYIPYYDYGQLIVLFIPKVIGQKLKDAENLVLEKIEKLKKGDFDESLLEAIKIEKYKDLHQQFETAEGKAMMFAELFAADKDIEEEKNIPIEIMKITKHDIVKIANKYFTENFLAFYSKMGKMKKEKIEKPGFKPIVSNLNEKSEFAKQIEHVKKLPIKEKFVDFKNDIYYNRVKRGYNFYYSKNPYNDIFTLKIKYGVGTYYHPYLSYAAQFAMLVGTTDKKAEEIKLEFAKLGCNYEIFASEDYTVIEVTGIEKNFEKCIVLLNKFLKEIKPEQEKMKQIIQGAMANRRVEKSEPMNVSDALHKWVIYKDKSPYINRPSLGELKKVKADSLIKVLKTAFTYEGEIHYCGQLNPEEVIKILKDNFEWNSTPQKSLAPADKNLTEYKERNIFIINDNKARQSNIRFYMLTKPYNTDDEPYIDAFNTYFSGDFSGLVMQEIREFRSLAYTASANYVIPKKFGQKSFLIGYIGTQSDKTIEAIQVFDSLVYQMPKKEDRWPIFIEYLVKAALSSRPSFRDLTEYVAAAKMRGYNYDPNQGKAPLYYDISFNDVYEFYKQNIQNKVLVISIVGDTKMFNVKSLEKYGKINYVKKSQVFK